MHTAAESSTVACLNGFVAGGLQRIPVVLVLKLPLV